MKHFKPGKVAIFVLFALFSVNSFGQFGQPSGDKSKDDFKNSNRFYVGGGIGFGISSYSTFIGLTPVIAYRVSPSVDVGARFTYTYNRYTDSYTNEKYSFNDFGIGAFGRYYLFFFNDLFIHGEYEALNYEYIDQSSTYVDVVKSRSWVSSLLIGAGYRQWIGNNAFVGMSVLFNLLDTYNSPYSNPIYRIGVGVGI